MSIFHRTSGSRLIRPSHWGSWMPVAILASTTLVILVVVGMWLSQPLETPLRISVNPWPGYSFAIVAQAKGFFEDEGVDVRLTEQYSLNDSRRAFERHQVDGFFGTIVEVLQTNAEGSRDAVVVMATDYSDGADVIMALPSIKTVADLRGKRIGVEFGTLNEYLLLRALEIAGVEWDDVERIHMPVLQMHEELERGRVDAVVTYPPATDDVRRTTDAQVIFDSSQIRGEIIDVLAVDRGTLETRRTQVDAFLRAYYRGQRYCRENPDDAYRIIAAHERTTVEDLKVSLTKGIRVLGEKDQEHFLGAQGRLPATLEYVRKVLVQSGVLKRRSSGRG